MRMRRDRLSSDMELVTNEIDVVGDRPGSTGILTVRFTLGRGHMKLEAVSLMRPDGTTADLLRNPHCLAPAIQEWLDNAGRANRD